MIEQRLAVSEGPFHDCPWCARKRTILGLLLHFTSACPAADSELSEASRRATGPEWSVDGWPAGLEVAALLDRLGHRDLATALRERARNWTLE